MIIHRPPDQASHNQPDLFDYIDHGKASRDDTYADRADTHNAKRQEVLSLIVGAGRHGMTLDELAVHFDVAANQISGRVTELKKRGLVRHTRQRRKTRTGSTASVIVATSVESDR